MCRSFPFLCHFMSCFRHLTFLFRPHHPTISGCVLARLQCLLQKPWQPREHSQKWRESHGTVAVASSCPFWFSLSHNAGANRTKEVELALVPLKNSWESKGTWTKNCLVRYGFWSEQGSLSHTFSWPNPILELLVARQSQCNERLDVPLGHNTMHAVWNVWKSSCMDAWCM